MLIVQYMESLGNDFVVIDGVTQLFEPSSGEISKLLNFDHEFSVDQIMLILPPDNSKFDFQENLDKLNPISLAVLFGLVPIGFTCMRSEEWLNELNF